MAVIVVEFQTRPGMLYRQERVRIGRRPPSEIVLTKETISRNHCVLIKDGERLLLQDAGSTGGLYSSSGERLLDGPFPEEGISLGGERMRAWIADPPGPTEAEVRRASDPGTRPDELEMLGDLHLELWRQIAANPATTAPMLARLARSPDQIVQRAVASNGNTPREVYLGLAEVFFGDFWQNPQLPLLLLEDSTLSGLSGYTLCSLLSHPAAPVIYLRNFLGHPSEVVREFARNALRLRED